MTDLKDVAFLNRPAKPTGKKAAKPKKTAETVAMRDAAMEDAMRDMMEEGLLSPREKPKFRAAGGNLIPLNDAAVEAMMNPTPEAEEAAEEAYAAFERLGHDADYEGYTPEDGEDSPYPNFTEDEEALWGGYHAYVADRGGPADTPDLFPRRVRGTGGMSFRLAVNGMAVEAEAFENTPPAEPKEILAANDTVETVSKTPPMDRETLDTLAQKALEEAYESGNVSEEQIVTAVMSAIGIDRLIALAKQPKGATDEHGRSIASLKSEIEGLRQTIAWYRERHGEQKPTTADPDPGSNVRDGDWKRVAEASGLFETCAGGRPVLSWGDCTHCGSESPSTYCKGMR